MTFVSIMIIASMLAFNAMFAAYELALACVSVARLAVLSEKGRPGAAAALFMKGRMEASLAVVQLGITLVGAVAAAVGGAGADEEISPWLRARFGVDEELADFLALSLVVLPLCGATIIFAELVPKSFAIKNAEWVCLKLSIPIRFLATTAYPIVLSIERMTKWVVGAIEYNVGRAHPPEDAGGLREFLAHARTLRTMRILSPQQERVIWGAGRLSRVTVREILLPAADIKLINADDPMTQHLVRVHLDAHTRFPVAESPNDPQTIVGYVNVKDLFFLAKTYPCNPNVREITRPIPDLRPETMIGDAFARMMHEHTHLALVRDAQGTVHGMITLEDVLEEVVGDIQDEFDRLPRRLIPSGRGWIAGGGVTLGQLRSAMHAPRLGPEFPVQTTLNEWISAHVPSPRTGETYTVDGIQVLIRKMRRGKTSEVVLASAPPVTPLKDSD